MTKQSIKDTLEFNKLAPKKRFGQNFLIQEESARRIVAASPLTKEDTIVEIGVGLGALTEHLARQSKSVIGLEIDAGIVRWLTDNNKLPPNATLLHQDVMKTDFKNLADQSDGKIKIVANLPYSLSNPFLFKLIENAPLLQWAVIMLQKEVGDRLMADEGSKTYGILSVLIKSCASVSFLMTLGPGHFHPRPKIDSVVLRLVFNPLPQRASLLPSFDRHLLKIIVNAAFQQRRKTLINALSAAKILGANRQTTSEIIENAEIAIGIRAERLTIEDFVRLARSYEYRMSL
jgi:16S rRNA (adenine1518-N6/adenine1519-N6)-dimethyltransferase